MNKEVSEILNLIKINNYNKAEKKCSKLIKKVKPNSELLNIYALILFQLKKYEQSIVQWENSTRLNPNYFYGYNNLGNAYYKLENFKKALECYQKAIDLSPNYTEAFNNKGNALLKLKNIDEAIKSYNQAIKLNNNYLPAIKSKADIHFKLKQNQKALIEINKVLEHEPTNTTMLAKKGDIHNERETLDLAIQNYELAFKIEPTKPFLLGTLLLVKNKMCNWENYESDKKLLENQIKEKSKVSPPYVITTIYDSPSLQFEVAKIWQAEYDFKHEVREDFVIEKNNKIKLGFFSADFRTHAMGHLMVRMLELHDKTKFELHGFYFGRELDENKDDIHRRIKNCFDSFTNINFLNDREVSELSRKKGIDIAIDLMCYTGESNRFGVFLNRVAPIQVNFLGYPGTSGSNCIDYIIADKTLVLEDEQTSYSEKIIYLPDTYQPNEETKKVANKDLKKSDLGLLNDNFIFCCFNAHQKITPFIFNSWMEILSVAKDSSLWLLKDNAFSEKNLKYYAEKRKIDPNRIIFADRLPLEDHLQRIQFADLFLDSYPYNAHTTCSDALRMNVPVITLKGKSFASRVAASLLKTLNLEELITNSIDDYKNLILKIYKDKNYLRELKLKIKENKKNSNLYKTDIFTKNIEKGYLEIYQNYIKGEKPKNINL